MALRNVDVVTPETDRHLVLISESDTFFARMNCLAFAGEIINRRAGHTNAPLLSFISQVQGGTNPWPESLHRFVYLRGLDGEAADADESKNRRSKETSERSRPASLEEIRRWTPEANKTEGSPQFDYLARLGDQIADLL